MPDESKESEHQGSAPESGAEDVATSDVATSTAAEHAPSVESLESAAVIPDEGSEYELTEDDALSEDEPESDDDSRPTPRRAPPPAPRAPAVPPPAPRRAPAAPPPAPPRASVVPAASPEPPRASVAPEPPTASASFASAPPRLSTLSPPALTHTGASQLPPSPIETIEAVAETVNRLRAEVAATDSRSRRARLLNEAAEIQERAGDEAGAARDYLGSYNSDTTFREPLESLVRLLERRRSLSNIGKLIEALVATSATPEERARALTQRALFAEDAQNDLEGARGAAREATETGANGVDVAAAWLALELVAAKLGDATERQEALAGRAELTKDSTWRALLLADAAELAGASSDLDRAFDLLARARVDAGTASFRVTARIDRLARKEPGIPGTDEAKRRSEARADALEAQAEMIRTALADGAAGDAAGVPRWVRSLESLVDCLMRAAEARRVAGDVTRAAELLDRALADIGAHYQSDEGKSSADRERTALERVLLTARLRIAELAGDTERAAELAERRAVGETDGGIAASLAMRVAEHAASKGDVANALVALSRATEHDPSSAPPRALKIDMLGDGDPVELATELESLARHFSDDGARGRAYVLAAYIWASRTDQSARAREALERAAAAGIPKGTIARLARSLASLRSDFEWYEHATLLLTEYAQSGVEDGATPAELPLLWIELARLRLARGDAAGAARATTALRALPEAEWLGRVLDGVGLTDVDPARARAAIEELAANATDPALGRSLRIVCALRARAAGDEATAIRHLEALAKDDPSDPLVAAYLGDLLRLAGDRAAAGNLAYAAAERVDADGDDPVRAAARYLEAGLESWRRDDRASAIARFRAAEACSPDAARAAVRWGARAVDVDSVDGRRRALDVAGDDASIALERFALEAALGDPDDAERALADVETASSESLRLAGAVARLSWSQGRSTEDALDALSPALDTISVISERTKTAAAAERHRIARETAGTGAVETAAAAKAWLDAGGGFPAAMEWLASAVAAGEPKMELAARRALAEFASDEPRESLQASAALLAAALSPDEPQPFVAGSSHAVRLANLELAPPGSDPRRRAAALTGLDGALGDDSELDALGLAAWSLFAAGSATQALDLFRAVAGRRPEDLYAWEGVRACSDQLGDRESSARACEQLGARCSSAERGALFWEEAALTWLDLDASGGRAEAALEASFARDARRGIAFDRLFRRVRERKEHDRVLALIERRLEVIDDPKEIAKLYWEQARALREKGDPTGALEALEHVTTFDEDHVGALALTGEIFIRQGRFEEAAAKLARLAGSSAAPAKNRVTAGVAAVDLYENKLGQHELALGVLLGLHQAGMSTLPVRERLARAAARTGSWTEATKILEELMLERPTREGRIEAARLAMAIHANRRQAPNDAVAAASKLLEEAPGDAEALDLVLSLDASILERRRLLEHGRDALLMSLHESPALLDSHVRLARIAEALGDAVVGQATLSCATSLAEPDAERDRALTAHAARKPRLPEVALDVAMFRSILAAGDDAPLAELFALLGPSLGEALGPTRDGLQVTRKDRVDPKAGTTLRAEIAQWAGAFGITTFDLYVGGKDPLGVQGVAGETPAIVVGSGVNAPLSSTTRARLVQELVGIVRGTTVLRSRDDTTVFAIAVAACNLAKVRVQSAALPGLAEIEKQLGKAMPRKVRAAIEPVCQAWVSSGQDPRKWAARARMTQAKFATLACGDVSIVLSDLFGEPVGRMGARASSDPRAHELFRFVLSLPYFDARRSLGLEGER